MAKKRSLNEYRQVKDTVYKNPVDKIKPELNKLMMVGAEVINLRSKFPNDQQFGSAVAELLRDFGITNERAI